MAVEMQTLPDTYQDSVKLMRVANETRESFGVDEAIAMMGTDENKKLLADMAQIAEDDVADLHPDDLMLAVMDDDAATARDAVERMKDEISGTQQRRGADDDGPEAPKGIHGAIDRLPDANLALISVPGAYATREAWKALQEGLHVHVFSDNVSLADERKLKEYGREHDLLVMGPDSGTAIVNQVPLGFANGVDDGGIGVVSAAGSGLQEVTALIDRAGAGISQGIGTGGRDLKDEIGGATMTQGMAMLADDEDTEVVVLVSKPPDAATMDDLLDRVEDYPKPVVVEFVGSDPDPVESAGAIAAESLADAARLAVGELPDRAGAADVSFADGVDMFTEPADATAVLDERAAPGADRTDVRGLFSGGTLCTEAISLLQEELDDIGSNVGMGTSVDDPLSPEGHAIIDLGADEFTRGRPHPMIDSSIRDEQLRQALGADDVLVVLLDVILGYGAHDDPAGAVVDLLEAVDAGDWPAVVASVVGTRGDPQQWADQIETLVDAGVYVAPSNADAARLAGTIRAEAPTNGGDHQ